MAPLRHNIEVGGMLAQFLFQMLERRMTERNSFQLSCFSSAWSIDGFPPDFSNKLYYSTTLHCLSNMHAAACVV